MQHVADADATWLRGGENETEATGNNNSEQCSGPLKPVENCGHNLTKYLICRCTRSSNVILTGGTKQFPLPLIKWQIPAANSSLPELPLPHMAAPSESQINKYNFLCCCCCCSACRFLIAPECFSCLLFCF